MNFLRKFYKQYCNKKMLTSPMAYLFYVALGGLALVTVVRYYHENNDYPKHFALDSSLDARLTTTEKRLGGIEKRIEKIAQLNEQHQKAIVDNRIEREVDNQIKNVKARSQKTKNRKKRLAKLIDELVDEA